MMLSKSTTRLFRNDAAPHSSSPQRSETRAGVPLTFAGSLADCGLAKALCQMAMHMESGVLYVQGRQHKGLVVLHNGAPWYAVSGTHLGDEAVVTMAADQDGSFRFHRVAGTPSFIKNIRLPVEEIVEVAMLRTESGDTSAQSRPGLEASAS